MTLGERLTSLRKERGLSVRDVARKINVSHVSVVKWVNGDMNPSEENIESLAELFGVTPAFLRYGDLSFDRPQTLEPNENEISIPVLDVRGSCGYGGNEEDAFQLVKMLRVENDWLTAKIKPPFCRNYLHIITAHGDSMRPTLESGDFIIIDTSQRNIRYDGIYVVAYSGGVFIKRTQLLPGGKVRLLSDNSEKYPPIIIDDIESVTVIGRAVLSFNARDL